MRDHNLERIDALLRAAGVVCAGKVAWFGEIDSTNSWLMQQRSVHGRVCLAELQTAGRGRRGRSWRAPRSSSVLLSLDWRLAGSAAAWAGLSLVSGLAVVAGLGRVGVDSVGLKWPNDVIARGRKLGGVLTELSGGRCVVGMGINVALPPPDPALVVPAWIDLKTLGHDVDRDALAAALMVSHCDYLRRFCDHGFAAFVAEWNDLNVHRDRPVSVESPTESFQGIVRGVDAGGALLIDRDGVRRRMVSGEVSLRAADPAQTVQTPQTPLPTRDSRAP